MRPPVVPSLCIFAFMNMYMRDFWGLLVESWLIRPTQPGPDNYNTIRQPKRTVWGRKTVRKCLLTLKTASSRTFAPSAASNRRKNYNSRAQDTPTGDARDTHDTRLVSLSPPPPPSTRSCASHVSQPVASAPERVPGRRRRGQLPVLKALGSARLGSARLGSARGREAVTHSSRSSQASTNR